MIHDLMSCLETLPPPYLTTAIIPCPHRTSKDGTSLTESTAKTKLPQSSLQSLNDPTQTSGLESVGCSYCPLCATAPMHHRQRRVFLLRNLCAALSVCLHQCLSVGGWLGPGQSEVQDGSIVASIALPASSGMTSRSGKFLSYLSAIG